MSRRLLVLVNRGAGTADDDAVQAAVSALRAGADVEVAATGDRQELDAAVASRGGRRLVVIGGDGSVHAAVGALDRAGGLDPAEPVGVIPRGTGNDLAGALGLPTDPAEAATVVLTGRARPLDLLRDGEGGAVVNAVHVGVGARAGLEADRFKEGLGAAAFPLGAVIAGVSAAGMRLRVEVDGAVPAAADWSPDGSTGLLMVGVCNGPTVGGGTALVPGARPDDGLVDVLICVATGPVARAAFAAELAAGGHLDREDVLVARGREVTVTGEPFALDADGETEEDVGARTWRVDHHAWSVLVPES